jgi:hypothetical protein
MSALITYFDQESWLGTNGNDALPLASADTIWIIIVFFVLVLLNHENFDHNIFYINIS